MNDLDITIKGRRIIGDITTHRPKGSNFVCLHEKKSNGLPHWDLVDIIKWELPKTKEYFELFTGGTGKWKVGSTEFVKRQIEFINKHLGKDSIKSRLEILGVSATNIKRILELNG